MNDNLPFIDNIDLTRRYASDANFLWLIKLRFCNKIPSDIKFEIIQEIILNQNKLNYMHWRYPGDCSKYKFFVNSYIEEAKTNFDILIKKYQDKSIEEARKLFTEKV